MPKIIDLIDQTDGSNNPESAFESKALFQLLMDGAKDYAIITLDADGKVATWNASAQRLEGYTAKEIIGKHFSIFYPEADAAAGKPDRELELARREGAYQEEGWRVGKDGTPFWASVAITPMLDPSGVVIGYSKVTRDVSERYLLNQQLNTFFEISPDMLIVVGFDGYFKRPSSSFQNALDFTLEELLATPWIDYIHPEDKVTTLAAAAQLETSRLKISVECRFRCRDGSYRRFQWNAVPIPERQLIFAVGRDITDSSMGEQRFRGLLESAPDAVVIENAKGEIIFVNSQTEKLFGFSRQDVLGNKVEILIPNRFGDHRSEHPDGFFTTPGRKAMGVGFDLYGVRKDGGEFPVEISLSPMQTDEGMLVISVIRDVTHCKEAEDAKLVQIELWQKSQQALERAQELAKLGNWELDVETMQVTWSRQLFTFFGIDPSSGAPSYESHASRYTPESVLRSQEAMNRAINEALPYALDLQRATPEGEPAVWLHVIAQPELNDEGKVVRVVGTAMDISDRKKSESAFLAQFELLTRSEHDSERAQELAHLGNWELDLATSKVTWSKQLFTLFGIDPADGAPSYESHTSHYIPEHASLTRAAMSRAVNDGLPYMADLQFATMAGEPEVWIHVIATPEFDGDGKVIRIVGTRMDISDRMRSEAALRSSQEKLRVMLEEQEAANTRLRISEENLLRQSKELVRSNTDLEQFAHVASHDLQEPLRMVASFMQLLEKKYKGQLDEQADRWIDHAVDGANRMQALIQDLLIYSRVGTHGKEFKKCNMEDILKLTLRNLQLVISDSQAEITADPLPSVHGDAMQFISLFQNLIGNAIKYRGPSPPKIHVSACRADEQWIFSISDNGIGILPEFAERIFVIFQRLHNRTSYPGTGIGLALCRRIVERHGGLIWMQSKPEKGTTFFIQLPDNNKQVVNA